jgi:putative tryptophan/tyrosine transport system substrate-binding protein
MAAVHEAAQRHTVSLYGPPLEAPFDEAGYRRVLEAMVKTPIDGLVVSPQTENVTNERLIAELAMEYRLPSIYAFRGAVASGGLMSYGISTVEINRHVAVQIEQILQGTKPGEIPYYQATTFELVINLKTAKALGLTIPPSLLARADEVIE